MWWPDIDCCYLIVYNRDMPVGSSHVTSTRDAYRVLYSYKPVLGKPWPKGSLSR